MARKHPLALVYTDLCPKDPAVTRRLCLVAYRGEGQDGSLFVRMLGLSKHDAERVAVSIPFW